jgi:hypothetical protein
MMLGAPPPQGGAVGAAEIMPDCQRDRDAPAARGHVPMVRAESDPYPNPSPVRSGKRGGAPFHGQRCDDVASSIKRCLVTST